MCVAKKYTVSTDLLIIAFIDINLIRIWYCVIRAIVIFSFLDQLSSKWPLLHWVKLPQADKPRSRRYSITDYLLTSPTFTLNFVEGDSLTIVPRFFQLNVQIAETLTCNNPRWYGYFLNVDDFVGRLYVTIQNLEVHL